MDCSHCKETLSLTCLVHQTLASTPAASGYRFYTTMIDRNVIFLGQALTEVDHAKYADEEKFELHGASLIDGIPDMVLYMLTHSGVRESHFVRDPADGAYDVYVPKA